MPGTVNDIAIADIHPFPGGNVREVFAGLDELAATIEKHGVMQPLVLTKRGGLLLLVVGERRLRAAKMAGLTFVPCIVQTLSDDESLSMMLIENLQREDLNPLEEAKAYRRLLDLPGATQGSIAERIGKSRPYVNEMLLLLDLPPELAAKVADGTMAKKVGFEYLRSTREASNSAKKKIASALIDATPSVRAVRRIIRQVLPNEERETTGYDPEIHLDVQVYRLLVSACQAAVAMEKGRQVRCARAGRKTIGPSLDLYQETVHLATAALERIGKSHSA